IIINPKAISSDTSTQSWISRGRGFQARRCFSFDAAAIAGGASDAVLDNPFSSQDCPVSINIPGPSFPRRREASLNTNRAVKVPPLGIALLDQSYLPGPFPFLELLFPGYGRLSSFVWFEINEHFNAIFPGESFNHTLFVMPYPLYQI